MNLPFRTINTIVKLDPVYSIERAGKVVPPVLTDLPTSHKD